MSKQRIIGTTIEAIKAEEHLIGKELPKDFTEWLLENNGLDIESIHIYPIKDNRDIRKTWESISYNLENGWSDWIGNFEGELCFNHLLPFADFGTGDYYCFDCNNKSNVVIWRHESGETEYRASNFNEFRKKIIDGEYEYD